MSRLLQYINETKRYGKYIIPDIVWEECQPFIKEAKGTVLWRSSKRKIYGNHEKVKLKANREPRFISKKLHEWLGKELKKMFGWNPRVEGLFCGSKNTAENFNPIVYMIFPIGRDYKYIWVKDTDIYEYYDAPGFETPIDDPILANNIRSELKQYNNKDIDKFQTYYFGECILKCKEYYMVKPGN